MFGITTSKNRDKIVDLSLGTLSVTSRNMGKYGPAKGLEPLRSLVLESYKASFDDCGVLITNGAIGGIDTIIRSEVSENDTILIPEYCFPPYVNLLKKNNIKIITYRFRKKLGRGYALDMDYLQNLVDAHPVKLIVLNFPHNPTGAILTADEAKRLAEIIKEKNIRFLSDEVYNVFDYTGLNKSISGFYQNGFVVSSLSKSHAAASIRIGWVVSSNILMKDIFFYHENSVGSVSLPSQRLAARIFKRPTDVALLQNCRDVAVNILDSFELDYIFPEAGFFVCIKSKDPQKTCERLLTVGIKVASGKDFGLSSYIRVSFASSLERVEESFKKIASQLSKEHNSL